MTTYDGRGRRVPTARRGRRPSDGAALGMALAAVLLAGALAAWLILDREAERREAQRVPVVVGPTHDSLTVAYTYDGEAIRAYVITDPDTGAQYIVTDRGGICRREGAGE